MQIDAPSYTMTKLRTAARRLSVSIHGLSTRRFWSMVLLAGLSARVAAVLIFGDLQSPQLYEYGGIARHLLAGQGYSTVFPILYPEYGHVPKVYEEATPSAFTLPGFTLIIAAVLAVAGEGTLAYSLLYLLNIAAGLLSVVVISALAGMMAGEKVARWTALLAALYPATVIAVATFGGTPWYHLVMSLALFVLLRAARSGASMRSFLLAGLAAGVWMLFRAEAAAALLLLGLWLWKKTSWRRVAVYAGAALMLLTPWALRNSLTFESFVPFTTNAWLNAWRGNNAASTGGSFHASGGANWLNPGMRQKIEALPRDNRYELRVMEIYRRETLSFVRDHPLHAAALYVRKLGMFFTIDYSDKRARNPFYWLPHGVMMLGALAGAVVLFRRRSDIIPLAAVILTNAVVVSALHVESRYQLILALLYIVFMAAAVSRMLDNDGIAVKHSYGNK
jgi:hypothetical protein